MASNDNSWIKGEASRGDEFILPKQIDQPEPCSSADGLSFSKIVKVFSDDAKREIMMPENGFKIRGNEKKYDRSYTDENQEKPLKHRFSWWSMSVEGNVWDIIKNRVNDGEETDEIYQKDKNKSRYGTNRLTLDFDYVVSEYNKSAEKSSEIRVLGTFKYTREVMHALVVCPVGHPTFADHPLVGNDEAWLKKNNGERKYFPYSVIKWNGRYSLDWYHLAFAFSLDKLTDQALVLPQIQGESKWSKCELSTIDLRTSLKKEKKEE